MEENVKEKKIKDLTGNREEKIASKKSASTGETNGLKQNVRPAPKRPFVRMAQPASQMTEHLSGKLTGAGEEKEPVVRQNERRPFERPAKQQRGERREERERRTTRAGRAFERREPHKAEQDSAQTDRTEKAVSAAAKSGAKGDGRQGGRPNAKKGTKAQQTPRGERGSRPERVLRQKSVVDVSDTAGGVDIFPRDGVPAAEEVITEEQLRADGLLFSMEDAEPVAAPVSEEETERFEVVGIRFRNTGKTYYFSPNGILFSEGEHAILETVRGVEYGEIVLANRWVDAGEVVQPLKPVVRKATEEDAAHDLANHELEERARPVFLEKVQKHKLEMQLVDVEYTFDNSKLCFYFTAEGRVDFRELVKDLAAVFRTRIELRQIGVRDEARLFGGIGVCGRPFCCKSFLSDFVQVSIKMAKEQNLSLASAKISGSCGRLMCCLRYEQDTYERENAALPRPNSTVETPKGRATVLESSFLTGKVKVCTLEDHVLRYFTPEEVRVIAPPRKNTPEKSKEEVVDEEEAKSTEN